MKPLFWVVERFYPTFEDRDALFTRIGWADLIKNPAFKDTCAIRMSVALLSAGVVLPGARMMAHAGKVKGKRIEPGQARLSKILKALWGEPEVYKGEQAARSGIGTRSGVISFFHIYGGLTDGGHIDLVSPIKNVLTCARSCHFRAVEIWFWPLQ